MPWTKRRLLIVAYYYPPVGGVGVLRTLKFTRYLPEFGIAPYILTARNRSFASIDASLLVQVPSEAAVVETFSAEHRVLRAPRLLGVDPKWFLVPDSEIGWLPFAVRSGEALIRQRELDAIFATAPPFTDFLVGHLLRRRTGRPLILDYRDPWTQNPFTRYPTAVHRKLEERMESRVLRSADYVITTTDEMAHRLVDKYPFVRGKCETIPNGFDASDFHGLNRAAAPGHFVIAYTGRLYGLRTAAPFLTAVRNIVHDAPGLRDIIRVIFAGPKDPETINLVERFGLRDIVNVTGFIPHRQSLQIMLSADVLLLVMSQQEVVGNGVGAMMIPGKTFEYLGARRPILALAPPGVAASLIRRFGAGMVVPPEDVMAIGGAIRGLLARWEAGTLSVEPVDVSSYDRRSLTARLAEVIRSLPLPEDGSTARDRKVKDA